MWKMPAHYVYPLILAVMSPLPAWALCCPSVGQKPARSGIGEAQPPGTDLSLDRRWRVHTFERDAMSYFQVSDHTGSIQFILGKSGDYFWLLPAGSVDTRVSLPSNDGSSHAAPDAVEVYRDEEFKLLVRASGAAVHWLVEKQLGHP